jgi:urea carboxylase
MSDPLIAKVMVHASGRERASKKMMNVLSGAKLQGPPTNLHFLRDVVSSYRKFYH